MSEPIELVVMPGKPTSTRWKHAAGRSPPRDSARKQTAGQSPRRDSATLRGGSRSAFERSRTRSEPKIGEVLGVRLATPARSLGACLDVAVLGQTFKQAFADRKPKERSNKSDTCANVYELIMVAQRRDLRGMEQDALAMRAWVQVVLDSAGRTRRRQDGN